jgi:hypothetical protein
MKDKSKNNFSMTLRLPEAVATELENVAHDHRMSKATFVRRSIRQALVEAKPKEHNTDQGCKTTKSETVKTGDAKTSRDGVLSQDEIERLNWCRSVLAEEQIVECEDEAAQFAYQAMNESEAYELLLPLLVKMKRLLHEQQSELSGGEK